jgi:hypothetical protein
MVGDEDVSRRDIVRASPGAAKVIAALSDGGQSAT